MPFDRPDSVMWFRPDVGDAPGLVDAAGFEIKLSYDEDGVISQGAYSTLYQAIAETNTGRRPIAVKVFHKGTREEDARQEYEILYRLDGASSFLPHALAFGQARQLGRFEGGVPAIAQEFVPGTSVRELGCSLRCDGLTADQRIDIVLQMSWVMVRAVNAINFRGVCHGDLSYTNVLVARLPWIPYSLFTGYMAFIIDLGQAAVKYDPDTYGKRGTRFFCAPETVRGTGTLEIARSSADVYSIGALMAYLIRRKDYRDDDHLAEAYARARRRGFDEVRRWVTPEAGKDPDLASTMGFVVAACMREDPLERPGLASLEEDLLILCHGHMRTPDRLAYIKESLNITHNAPAKLRDEGVWQELIDWGSPMMDLHTLGTSGFWTSKS